ncbi:unnamed protein product [Ceutorhynchus assimilis]|uniref:Uncharacterized protein n=1 Tax=Ceutorhynchus assimilis TaxID=467358 RepID=A0A9N9MDU0_9CUCU|nr:unnamed protein product [Ceutorhynchus assimilis]
MSKQQKFLILAVAALAALQFVTCQNEDDALADNLPASYDNMDKLKLMIQYRRAISELESKVEKICPGHGYKVENVTMEMTSCVEQFKEDEETICSLSQKMLERCMSPLEDLLVECIPSPSKAIPPMVTSMMKKLNRYVCRINGEHIFEFANPCFKHINAKTQRCILRFSAKLEDRQRRKEYPSAQDACELMDTFKPCFQSHLNTACRNPITRETFLQAFDEVASVCTEIKVNENIRNNEIELA